MSEASPPAGVSAALVAELDAFIRQRVDEAVAAALGGARKAKREPGRLLTLPEAAERLRRSPLWLYHHHMRLRLSRRDGGRLMFPEEVLDRYLRALEHARDAVADR
jgi:hypothetical protein